MLKMQYKAIMLYLLFSIVITFTWRWYELKTFGEIQPDSFDSLIAVTLSVSLTVNVMLFGFLKKLKMQGTSEGNR